MASLRPAPLKNPRTPHAGGCSGRCSCVSASDRCELFSSGMSPGSARLRELNWCSDDAQAGYLEAPLCHSPNARARMGERRSATRASREKDSGSSVAPRAAPPSLRHRPPVSNETIGRSTDAAKGRGCWLHPESCPGSTSRGRARLGRAGKCVGGQRSASARAKRMACTNSARSAESAICKEDRVYEPYAHRSAELFEHRPQPGPEFFRRVRNRKVTLVTIPNSHPRIAVARMVQTGD